MRDKRAEIYRSLYDEMKELRYMAELNTEILKTIISEGVIPRIANQLRFDILVNLIDYTATNSAARHKTIKEAFWIIDYIIGFDYNPRGSFTWDGAKRAMSEDVFIKPKKYRLEVEIKGRIEDLEKGDVDWSALRRFFYRYSVQAKIKLMFPNAYKRIYDDLDNLFSFTKDPTEPRGRPYISQATDKNSEYMHEAIQKSVISAFGKNSEDGWIRTR